MEIKLYIYNAIKVEPFISYNAISYFILFKLVKIYYIIGEYVLTKFIW